MGLWSPSESCKYHCYEATLEQTHRDTYSCVGEDSHIRWAATCYHLNSLRRSLKHTHTHSDFCSSTWDKSDPTMVKSHPTVYWSYLTSAWAAVICSGSDCGQGSIHSLDSALNPAQLQLQYQAAFFFSLLMFRVLPCAELFALYSGCESKRNPLNLKDTEPLLFVKSLTLYEEGKSRKKIQVFELSSAPQSGDHSCDWSQHFVNVF